LHFLVTALAFFYLFQTAGAVNFGYEAGASLLHLTALAVYINYPSVFLSFTLDAERHSALQSYVYHPPPFLHFLVTALAFFYLFQTAGAVNFGYEAGAS